MSAKAKTDWFWSDWAGDPAVRRLSPAARGVWIDLLALASAGTPTGYVTDRKGRPILLDEIARFTNCPVQELPKLIGEIEEKGVGSRDRTGRLFNRRMVREANLAAKRRAAGAVGNKAKALNNNKTPDLRGQTATQKLERRGCLDPPDSQIGVGVEPSAARACDSACTLSADDFELSDAICGLLRWDREDPTHAGVPYAAHVWRARGYQPSVILDAIGRASSGKSIRKISYFDGAIEAAHARSLAPIQPQEAALGAHRQSVGGAYGAAKDRGRAAHERLKASIAEDERQEGRGQVVELVPAARRHGP
jgi:hypothetical protein